MGIGATFPMTPAIWTPYDAVTPDLEAWPIGNNKAMTQYSAGTYNEASPNAAGCAGHNQILSVLDNYQISILGGGGSGVAQAVSGAKQSPGALVGGINTFYTSIGKQTLPTFGNHAAGTRAPRILIKQMRGALDAITSPTYVWNNIYGGYVSRVWNGAGVPTDGYVSNGGECALSYRNGRKGGTIYRLWLPLSGLASLLGSWTGPIWYEISSITTPSPNNGTPVGTYPVQFFVADGAPSAAFGSSIFSGTPVETVSAWPVGGSGPAIYIPLGIYPTTIGSSGTITVCACFENDTTLVNGTVTTGTTTLLVMNPNSAGLCSFY
jgi:hypothetical protein